MKRHILSYISVLAFIMFSLTSCEEMQGSTNLRLRFTTSGLERSIGREVISPDGQSLAITGYVVSGSGPNDNTFSVSTASSQVDINGLVIGTWEITVTGTNQQGTAIATGSVTHHLTTSDNTVEVVLDEFIGSGHVNIGFSWSDPDFPAIGLELRLKPQFGTDQIITEGKTVNAANASARYQATLPTGSYDLSFTLSSAGTRIAGGVVAIRILDGFTSAKEISIVVDKQTPEATGLLISSDIAEPVEGVIEGFEDPILPNQQVTAMFRHDSGGGAGTLTVDWYLDGVLLGSGNTIDFLTHSGSHRLDAMARTTCLGSVGSATLPFRASVEAMDGVPVIVSDISQGDVDPEGFPYRLSGVSATAFLRDGRVLVASAAGLQLCEIRDDRLVILNNFTSTPGFNATADPFPVDNISDILVDTLDNVVITTARSTGTVVCYRYDAAGKTIVKIGAFQSVEGVPWGSTITNTAVDLGSNRLHVVDPAKRKLHYATYTSESVGDLRSVSIAASPGANHIAVKPDGSHLVIACADSGSFQTYLVSQLADGISILLDTNTSVGQAVDAAWFATWPVGDILHVNLSDGLYLYGPPDGGGTVWQKGNKISTGISSIQGIAYDGTYGNCWMLEGPTQPEVSASVLVAGVPVSFTGSTSTGSFAATGISISPKGNFIAISGNDRLMLMRISDS